MAVVQKKYFLNYHKHTYIDFVGKLLNIFNIIFAPGLCWSARFEPICILFSVGSELKTSIKIGIKRDFMKEGRGKIDKV